MPALLAITDYAFALGSGVALASLNNVENHLGSRNRRTVSGALEPVSIFSATLDPFPVRLQTDGGKEVGGGFVNHEWTLVLATYGLKYYLDTYFSSGTVVSVNMTIYTRLHMFASYARYNAIAILPGREAGDIAFIREGQFQGLFRLRQRFRDLVAL